MYKAVFASLVCTYLLSCADDNAKKSGRATGTAPAGDEATAADAAKKKATQTNPAGQTATAAPAVQQDLDNLIGYLGLNKNPAIETMVANVTDADYQKAIAVELNDGGMADRLVKQVISNLDTDQSGGISEAELLAAKTLVKYTPAETDQAKVDARRKKIFARLDNSPQDGSLSATELLNLAKVWLFMKGAFEAKFTEGGINFFGPGGAFRKVCQNVLDIYDKDKDGELGNEEWDAFQRDLRSGILQPARI